jgi:hypothetical protein
VLLKVGFEVSEGSLMSVSQAKSGDITVCQEGKMHHSPAVQLG